MFNELIVVSVTPFSGTSDPDKNGNFPVMLQCIAGRMPNRNVMSGTVAQRAGIEVGKTYLMQVREAGIDKVFGTDFSFTKVKEIISAEDVIKSVQQLGIPQIIVIPRPEGFKDEYERKTNAVEGLRTKRIKEGLYEPSTSRDVSHKTAEEIIQGSSTKDDTLQDLGGHLNADKNK